MSHPNKAKGTAWEREVRDYLNADPDLDTTRNGTRYGRADESDLDGIPLWVLELKNAARHDLAGWLREAKREAANAGKPYYAVVVKNRRGPRSTGRTEDGYFVVPLWLGRELLKARLKEPAT